MTSILKADKIEGVTSSGTVQMPAGMVIQTVKVQQIFSEVTTTDTSAYVNSNMALAITPKFASSTILFLARAWTSINQSSGGINMQVTRTISGGSATNFEGGHISIAEYGQTSGPSYREESKQFMCFDTPNTTTATTYTITFKSGGGTARVGVSNRTGTIIIQEIAQ
jgi:hypothetical protein